MITLSKWLLIITASAGLMACGGGSDSVVVDKAQVRVIHASPDAPNVDVFA